MLSEFSDCRVCGLHFSNEDVVSHELNCLQRSQEQLSSDVSHNSQHDVQTNEDDKPSTNVNQFQNQNPDSNGEDEEDNDEEDFISREDIFLPNPNEAIPLQMKRHQGNPGNPIRDVRSSSSCHQHDATTSNRSQSMAYDRKKPSNLFPPTKKYRYYPVTCEYCRKRFQPNKLKAHQRKQHFGEADVGIPSKRVQSAATRKGYAEPRKTTRSRSVGGIPRRLQVCYICGRLYGSKSIKIHEPKCLDKWRIQNEQLPFHRRAPEPVKPEPLMQMPSGQGTSLPSYDAAADAAFRSHLQSLIPCGHCSRTFSPDRIMKHESCCIERPKSRQCITPPDGKIGR